MPSVFENNENIQISEHKIRSDYNILFPQSPILSRHANPGFVLRMQCNHVGRCGISLGAHRPGMWGAMAGRMGSIDLCRVGRNDLGVHRP